jgi:hypothetical protein
MILDAEYNPATLEGPKQTKIAKVTYTFELFKWKQKRVYGISLANSIIIEKYVGTAVAVHENLNVQ